MRLTAIETPKSLLLKIAYYTSRKQFGKVIAPLKYIYSKSIPALLTSLKIYKSENRTKSSEGNTATDPVLYFASE